MKMLVKQYLSKRRYMFFCEDGTTLLYKNKPKRHRCNADSKKASAEQLSKCAAERPHMRLEKGKMALCRTNGEKLYVDVVTERA